MRLESAGGTSSANTSGGVVSDGLQPSAKANLAASRPERSSETSTPSAFEQTRDTGNHDILSSHNHKQPHSRSSDYVYHGLTSASALDDASWSHIPSRDISAGPRVSTEGIRKQLEAEASKQREFTVRALERPVQSLTE